MPFTFPSHQAAVLPLKLWRPQWFDGVALCVGAAAPDVAYVFDGSGLPVWPLSHEWLGLVLWNLPVTLVIATLLRWAAPVVAAHLPAYPPLALRDYGALGRVRHRWYVTWSSAVIGAASHLGADAVEDLSPLLDPTLSVVGLVATALLVWWIGRNRLIRAWHGPPTMVTSHPALFWAVAAAIALPGVLIVPTLPAAFLTHTTGARLITVVAIALLASSAVVRSGLVRQPAG